MLADLILGIAAGAGAPYAEPKIKSALESVLLSDAPLSALELRMVSLAICLVGAAILGFAFGESEAFPLTVGALVGVFGPRIIDRIQNRKEPDYGPDPEKE